MIDIRVMSDEDCNTIIQWNKNKGEEFLYQWAGRKVYKYPLTLEQIQVRRKRFSQQMYVIYKGNRLIGSIEFSDKGMGVLHIARFILDEGIRNRGVGQRVLKEIVEIILKTTDYEKITLSVFCFNKIAIHCYEKVGFEIKECYKSDIENWDSYLMEIQN